MPRHELVRRGETNTAGVMEGGWKAWKASMAVEDPLKGG
jgi:hypothetical protein